MSLELFANLPLKERLFVRARHFSAPLAELVRRAPSGTLADIGCGHGLLSAMLAKNRADRTVLGIDPDLRKIDWANRGPGHLKNVHFGYGIIDDFLPEFEGRFDGVLVADVLYLLPEQDWPAFLRSAHRLLKREGRLLIKECAADGSWKQWKCEAQERVMVNLFHRTHSSGGLELLPRAGMHSLIEKGGFIVDEVADLSAGYTSPHLLFSARRRESSL